MNVVKIAMFVCLLSVMSFGKTKNQITNELLSVGADTVYYIEYDTGVRTNMDTKTFESEPFVDKSTMTWFFNIRTGYGWCEDTTGTISSMYTLSDVTWYNVEADENNGNGGIYVTGVMTSDAGNMYIFTMNDAINTVTMTGLNSVLVHRKYHNITVSRDKAKNWKSLLKL